MKKPYAHLTLNDALTQLQCEFVAERNEVNPAGISWLQYDILSALRDSQILPSMLSRQLAISRTKLSKSLSELRSLGYITQTQSTKDRREMLTSLSSSGEHLLSEIDQKHRQLTSVAQSIWTYEEQETFSDLATRMIVELKKRRTTHDER